VGPLEASPSWSEQRGLLENIAMVSDLVCLENVALASDLAMAVTLFGFFIAQR
jgi:hypothetical protein